MVYLRFTLFVTSAFFILFALWSWWFIIFQRNKCYLKINNFKLSDLSCFFLPISGDFCPSFCLCMSLSLSTSNSRSHTQTHIHIQHTLSLFLSRVLLLSLSLSLSSSIYPISLDYYLSNSTPSHFISSLFITSSLPLLFLFFFLSLSLSLSLLLRLRCVLNKLNKTFQFNF